MREHDDLSAARGSGKLLEAKKRLPHGFKLICFSGEAPQEAVSFSELLESIAKLEEYKLSIKDCFGFMQMWYRDILIFKATRDPNLLIFAEEYSAISKVAQTCGYNEINRILEAINTASARLDANVNFQLTLELLWLTIRECQK